MKPLRICLVLVSLSPLLLHASTRAPLQARETMLSPIRATLTNDGVFGYGFDRHRRGGIWPRSSASGFFDVGGLWFICQKRVGGVMQDVFVKSVDPFLRQRGFTPGTIADNQTLTDTTWREHAQVFSSAFMENTSADPMSTHVWPVRIVGDKRTVVLDAAARDSFPRYEISDEDLFALYSAADSLTTISAGVRTLGVDVEQMVYSWYGDSLRDAVVLEYRITNRSSDTLFAPITGFAATLVTGDTARVHDGRYSVAFLKTDDGPAYVLGRSITSDSMHGSVALFGLSSSIRCHELILDSSEKVATVLRSRLSAPSAIDSIEKGPGIVLAQQDSVLVPGATITFRCAIAMDSTGDLSNLKYIRHILLAANGDYSGHRTAGFGILDAEVSDSNTSFLLPNANVHVQNPTGDISFDVLTDDNGAARVRVPLNQNLTVTASAQGFADASTIITPTDPLTLVPFQLAEFKDQELVPTTPSFSRLGDFFASARVLNPRRAAALSNHVLQVVTEGVLTADRYGTAVSVIPFHIQDATAAVTLRRDTLYTNLLPCGDVPDSITAQHTVLIDSAISITVSMNGHQELEPASTVSAELMGYVPAVNTVVKSLGSDSASSDVQCSKTPAGSGSYSVQFQLGGPADYRVGPYLLNLWTLNVVVNNRIYSSLPYGGPNDTANAGKWTMRVGAWTKHGGKFVGYPCLDNDPTQCEYFDKYFFSTSLQPYLDDSLVFAHCITVNGNRFGIDFANKGIPSIKPWPVDSVVPTVDINEANGIDINFSGGISANFPTDSAIISFQLPVMTSVAARSPVLPSMDVYPQPAAQIVEIDIPTEGSARIEVSDMLGRLIMAKDAKGGTIQSVNVSLLVDGVYDIAVRTLTGVAHRTLVVAK